MKESRQLRGEGKDAITLEPIERLLPEAVTRQKESAPRLVVNGESEHAVQAIQHPVAPLTVAVEQDLGVGVIRLEEVPFGLQFPTEIGMVVDLTVEDNGQAPVGIRHRLGAPGEIDNGETSMAEMDSRFGNDSVPLGIRPAMGQRTGHSFEGLPVTRITGCNESRDPAHQRAVKFLVSFTR